MTLKKRPDDMVEPPTEQRFYKVIHLLSQAFGVDADAGKSAGSQSKKAGSMPSVGSFWNLASLLDSFGCQPQGHAHARERAALGQEISALKRRRTAVLELLDELEAEAVEVAAKLAEKAARSAELLRLDRNGGADTDFHVAGCCDDRRRGPLPLAAGGAGAPAAPLAPSRLEAGVETRAVLRERVEEVVQELHDARQELATAQWRRDVEVTRLQEKADSKFSTERLVRRHSKCDVQLRQQRFARFLAGAHVGDFAKLRMAFSCWRESCRQRALVLRLLRRTFAAAGPAAAWPVYFYSWKVRVLARRRRRAERWRATVRRFALKFVEGADAEVVRTLMWEWFKMAKLSQQLSALEHEALAECASPPEAAKARLVGEGGHKTPCCALM